VDPKAQLADDCSIGPYCTVGPGVTVGSGTEIGQGCQLAGKVTIGVNNIFSSYCCLGTPPQDLGYRGEQCAVEIGDKNIFREFCTVNMGTAKDRRLTSIGNGNYFMAYVHVAHDCVVGNHVVMVNYSGLSGHSTVEDNATISALTGTRHYVTVGQHAFIGGLSRIFNDVPPYMIVEGNPSRVHRVNIVGLERHGFTEESIEALKEAHRILYRSKLIRLEAFEILESRGSGLTPEVRYLIDFLKRQMAGRQGRQREILRGEAQH